MAPASVAGRRVDEKQGFAGYDIVKQVGIDPVLLKMLRVPAVDFEASDFQRLLISCGHGVTVNFVNIVYKEA